MAYKRHNSEMEKMSLLNELDAAQNKQTELLDSVLGGVAIYRVKKDGRIPTDYVSDGLARICGYDDEKDIMRVMAEDSRKLVLPEDYPVVAAACKQSIEKGIPTNVNYRIWGKDGNPVRITLDSVVMKNAVLEDDDIAVFYAVQTLVSDDMIRAKTEQDYYRMILDMTQTTYFEVDEDGNFYTSESFSKYKVSVYGLSSIMGDEHAKQCFHADDFERVKTYLHGISKSNAGDSVIARMCMQDGSYQWTELTAHIEYTSAHKIKRMTGILRNINLEWEKQKAELEKELDDNRKKERTLMAGIPGGVAIYHVKKNGKVTTDYVSESLAKMCGYTVEEFLLYLREDSMINLVPEDIPIVKEALDKCLANDEPLSVMYHIYKKDRTTILIRLDANTIHSDAAKEDDVAVLYAVHTLVSDESKKIIDEQQMLKKLVDEVPAGLGIYDITEGKIDQVYMNEAFYTMLGTVRDERIKYTHENAILAAHPDDIALIHNGVEKLLAGEQQAEVTYRLKNSDTKWFWVHLCAYVVERRNHFIRIYAAFTDYNQMIEAQQKAMIEQQRYRVAADEMNAAVFEWDLKDHSFYSSNAYQNYAFSRVSTDDILNNRGPVDVIHPDDQEELIKFFTGSESGASRVEVTLRLKLINGDYRWCRMIGLFYRNEEQEPTRTVGIIIDVNEEHEENIKLQKLLDEIPGGVGSYDYYNGKLELTYLNEAYFAMIGVERKEKEQYMGFNAIRALHPDDVAKTIELLKRLEAGEDHADIYQRICNGEGNWIWMKFATSVTERMNGHTKLIAAITDCDELIRTQEALQSRYEDQVRYTRMVASGAVASVMVNLTKQTLSLQNTNNKKILKLICEGTPQQIFQAMCDSIPDKSLQKDYSDIFDIDVITSEFENGITHKSIIHPYQNYACWYESTYDALRNPKTSDLEVYCVVRDVTKEVLQNSINQNIMTHSYDEVLLIDPQTGEPTILVENGGSAVYQEQDKAKDFEKGLENYILRFSADECPKEIAASLGLHAVISALEEQDVYTVSYSIYNLEHNLLHRSASYTYLNKYKTQILCVIQDITSVFEKETHQREILQAALAETRKASHAKADFYSRMSHDMRTPMNGILGMANLSEDETDSTILKDNLKKIKESGEYLLSLINDTLDIQRIESGKMVLEPKIVRTSEVIGNILDIMQSAAKSKGVDLKYNFKEIDLNSYIRADALRLKQVFINLLSNAVKFTPAGGTVDCELKLVSREDMLAHDIIYIRDTGVGMSKEFLENGIFKPFSQESNEVSTLYAGSGLGLSIAKSLVELMNGKIEVESELGVGTTFKLYLNFERVERSEAELALQKRAEQKENFCAVLQGKKILLVEDHPLNAEISKKLLRKVGCEVTWVKNGLEAVNYIKRTEEGAFQIILMDIRMPVMDGLEASKRIRALNRTDCKTVPIIAMTANAYEDDVKSCMEVGMNDHLGKPIEPQKLYEKLVKYTC